MSNMSRATKYFPGKVIQTASGVNVRSLAGRSRATGGSLEAAFGSQLCYDAELHGVGLGEVDPLDGMSVM
jgi:hypothetical protein